MRTRRRSIRTKIIALLTVPLVGLIGLWAFATVLTVGPVVTLLDSQTKFEDGSRPATVLVAELQAERRAAVTHLSVPNRGALDLQSAQTDTAMAEFRRRADGPAFRDVASAVVHQRLDDLLGVLDQVTDNRAAVIEREQERAEAAAVYTEAIEVAYLFLTALTVGVDTDLSVEGRAVVELGRGRELISQIDAVLTGAHTGGAFEHAEPHQLHQLIGVRRAQYRTLAPDLPATVREDFAGLLASDPLVALTAFEEELLSGARPGEPVPIDMVSWRITQAQVLNELEEFELATAEALADQAAPIAFRMIAQMLAVGVIGLIVVVGTLVATLRVGRSLIERLTSLRDSAQELAHRRLPDVVARLRRAESVDVAAEAPELRFGNDEIGDVGHAFNDVQRTAVAAAVEEAKLRQGLNEVFLNIARRSQTLLHRQLEMLDQMERRAEQPDELEQLFKLDHMTTRMRRHAENLVVLAGGAPGRGWRNAVPVVDVVRGAVSEVEDYTRVSTVAIPQVAITGRAVGDLIHLLAELLENATAYSPPHTEVRVTGLLVPNGLGLEIEDRGLGMTSEDLARANAVLATPPEFGPAHSQRLGLLVVAHIATRLDVRVTLRPSPYGGVAAVVLIPPQLIEEVPPSLPSRRPPEEPPAVERPGPGVTRPGGAPALALVGSAPEETMRPGRLVGRAPVLPEPAPDGELPRRTSKRHLAAIVDGGGDDSEPTSAPAPREPEQVRALLSSYQRGLARGRADASTDNVTQGDTRGPDHQ